MCSKHDESESVRSFVKYECCVDFDDVESLCKCIKKKLGAALIGHTFHRFLIEDLYLCGSFKEDTRIQDPDEDPVTVEFDFLCLTHDYRGQDAGYDLSSFKKAVKEKIIDRHGSFYGSVTDEGGSDYLLYRCSHSKEDDYKVLIDIHPAIYLDSHQKVFEIPLYSFWRKSYVKKEVEIFRNSRKHVLPFRILKYIRTLMHEDVQYSKYALKTAVLIHIGQCECDHVKDCTLDIMDILYKGLKQKMLGNVFSGWNVLKQQDKEPEVAKEFKRMRRILNDKFKCVRCFRNKYNF